MFGSSSSSSPPKENEKAESGSSSSPPKDKAALRSVPDGVELTVPETSGGEKRAEMSDTSQGRKSGDEAGSGSDKKRRSSRTSALIASAKNSLHLSGSSSSTAAASSAESQPVAHQSPMQKMGKKDPALAVPQGSQNNSAGESLPGARSTFRVGVTEDKNKKCRRTMEDTHAYLYNFLTTPAPAVHLDTASSTGAESSDELAPTESDPSLSPGANVVETDNGYFAIFDGHAGTFAADWCGKKLHIILEEAIRKNPNTPVPELLDQTFTTVDQQLETLPLKNSGCTAVTAVLRWEDRIPNAQSATGSTALAPATAAAIRASSESSTPSNSGSTAPGLEAPSSDRRPSSQSNLDVTSAVPPSQTSAPSAPSRLQESAARQRVLYTANVGDARIVLCRNGKALRLSYDHKGSDENEGKRVANAGGLILNNRVNGVLAVTRALGDAYMKDLVTGHPYTTETVIQPDHDEFIILACDGVRFMGVSAIVSVLALTVSKLWDVCSDQEAVDLVRHVADPQLASKTLVDHALARFSTDNLSCMIVRFDSKAVLNTVERRVEPIGVEGDPASSRLKGQGISEAEHLVREARQLVEEGVVGEGGDVSAERIVEEADEGEPGPELVPEGTGRNGKG
ncbi:MAG: Protein phosphatase 2C 1 [Caeruleum heppii]|nr:MAG: Protein phosphatase 2C 1 [Caeruleum heppii]